jgi:hypothetical protein
LFLENIEKIISKVTAPDKSRIIVKLLASINFVPSASRQSIELKANAVSAKVVKRNIFNL